MALFKILKGVEKKDSNGKSLMLNPAASGVPEIHEGWAYVTTDEGNMYVDVTDTKRVKIGAKSDLALQAISDDKGQNIATTYIKDIALTEDDESPIYVVARGDNTTFNLKIPIAGPAHAGVITAGDQTINGKKTIQGSLVILGDAADKKLMTRGIIGSDGNGAEGDLYLQYGNSTADSIYLGSSGTHKIHSDGSQYTGNAATATIAVNDDKSQNIAQTYIKGLAYVYENKSIPELKFVLGDNNEDYIAVPVATDTNGGIVTIDAQTFSGAKTFNGAIIAKSTIAADENISTNKQFISTVAKGTAPLVVTSDTVVTNLNADYVDGKSASNDTFTAGGASTDIVPTQRAIMNSLNDMLMASQALVYRGLIDPTDTSTYPPTPVTSGSVYVISKEGTFDNQYCEPGDIVIGYYIASSNKTQWDIIQNNINGAVVIKDGGSVSRTDITLNAIPRFDTANGRVIKNSKITIDDAGALLPVSSNVQEIGASTNVWKNIFATNFIGLATNATYDDIESTGGNPIKNKYIAGIQLVDHATDPYYQAYDGTNSAHSTFNLPIATPTTAGVITNSTQTISGGKTIDENGSLVIKRANGFNYEGLQENSAAKALTIWFSHNTIPGTPCINSGLTFNPSSTADWTNYDANTPAAYGELKADRFNGIALQSLQDDMGGTIKKKYFAGVALTNHATAPYYTFYDGTNTAFSPTLPLPVADTTNAGIVTTAAQTFAGNKTFNGQVHITSTSGFYFDGMESGGSPAYRPVWFAHSERATTPVYNENFQYNPASTESWDNYDGKTVAAYGSLSCARFQGISLQALNDDMGDTIKKKYIAGITLTNHGSAPYYTLFDGTNTAFAPTLPIPVANTEQAGVVTKVAQSFAGHKQFTGGVEFTIADFNYSGIEHATDNASRSVWFADSTKVGKPCYNNSFLYNPSEQRLYITNITGTITNAIGDESGQNIKGTYLAGAALDTNKFVFTFTLGNNNILAELAPNFAASDTNGGSALVANLLDSFDTRNAARNPQATPKGISANFKSNAIAGLNDGGSYVGIMSWRSYGNDTDLSGGYPMEFAYTANKNLYLRFGTSATAWSDWDRVLTDANFSTKTDSVFGGSSNRAKYLETWQTDKSKTFDQAYPLYGWWRTGDICKLTVDNYKTEIDYANLLTLHNTNTSNTTRSISPSDWSGAVSGVNFSYVWGQSWRDSAIGTDSGDMVLALRPGVYTTGSTELCMMIDGDYYSMGKKVLHEGNYNNYALPLTGGAMTGSPVITFPASAGSLSASTPMSITYGRIASYGTLCINANTDNSGTEYIILTAGNGLSSDVNAGLAVGSNTLTWLGSPIMTLANYTSTLDGRYVKLSGDTMTGQLKTSFKQSVAMGSYQAAATTLAALIEEVRYSSGCAGSVNLTSTYAATAGGTIAIGWYNFLYIPHRSGGANGAAAGGDNCDYGTLLLTGMTMGSAHWRIRFTSKAIAEVRRVWNAGDSVTGAVWNDYAECRESDTQEAGYVLSETGKDNLVKTTERLQHFAGVSSDTWGFSQGETEKAKTHIAVAGRVLVYPYQDRNNYKPGDCVCAAPGGTVDIMTREEVVMYPDRIVGTVSCVPEYETWGGGEMADRDPVQVNGRIWIKVR
jgi:hypothetical protein